MEYGLKFKKLKSPSTTRWVERVKSLDGFLDAYAVIYNALDYMQFGGCNNEFKDATSDAQAHFRNIESFEFIVSLVITQNILDYT